MDGKKIVTLMLLLTWIFRVEGGACSPDDSTRQNNHNAWKDDGQDTTLNNNGFLTDPSDPDFDITCCGVIKAWQFIVGTYTGTPSIDLQIWRLSGTTWTLVGQNTHTLNGTTDSLITHSVNAADRISVKSGDAIGWYANGQGLVTYENGGGSGIQYWYQSSSTQLVGSVFPWASATNGTNRKYNIEVIFDTGYTANFTNLDYSISVPDYTAVGTPLYTITYSNAENVSMAASTDFNFDSTTDNVTNLQYIPDGATDLTFTATDICGNPITNKLTISAINSVPVINSLPSYTEMSEDLQITQLLHTINVTDMSPLDTVTCSLASSSSDFTITSNTLISIQSNPSLDYDVTRIYYLTVSCTDSKETVNSTFTVYVTMNQPPVITNLWAKQEVSASSTTSGTTVFTVSSTDAENDILFYNSTCSPTSCPFTIQNTGDVQATQDLATHTVHAYDLYVYVYDGKNLVGPRTLTILITGINDPPVITNLPLPSLSIRENTDLGSFVYKVYFVDVNPTDSHTFSLTSDPAEGSNLFSVDSSGVISTSSTVNIDFESLTVTTFSLTITVSDGSGTDNGTIDITITDQNEAPSFNLVTYFINADEGTAGSVIGDPGFIVTDVDSSAQKSYSIDCPEFDINNETGEISYTVGYDADVAGIAASVTCTVTVSDGELTDTAALVININNINDNSPTFGKPSYILYTSANANVGVIIGTLGATDGDIGTYGALSYSLDQSHLGEEYFGVQSNGDVYVKATLMTFVNGSRVVISATVKDTGSLQDMATVTILIAAYSTEDTVTSYDYLSFIDDPRNVAWLTVLCIILLGLFSLLSYFAYKYGRFPSTHHCCNKPKKLRSHNRRPTSNNRWGKQSPPPSPEVQEMPNIADSTTNYKTWEAWNANDHYF